MELSRSREFTPPRLLTGVYVLAYDESELLGLFIVYPRSSGSWEVHTCLLPASWGERALRVYRDGVAWLFANTECGHIIGKIPEFNRLALRIAVKAGAKIIGIEKGAVLKDGSPRDVIIVGIERSPEAAFHFDKLQQ